MKLLPNGGAETERSRKMVRQKQNKEQVMKTKNNKIDKNLFKDIFSVPVKKKVVHTRFDRLVDKAKAKNLYLYKVSGGYEIDDNNGTTAVCKNLNEVEYEI